MQVGDLVNTPSNGIGVVIDLKTVATIQNHTMVYLLHYIDGTKHWWTVDHLEALCKSETLSHSDKNCPTK